ncbi:unnamed protein product [Linum trigynum]|uniref:Secreted protein n=1 Tax=Linum trigynum TaxID=586398 RepID=A0AAV2EL49_9ROSI
MPSTPTNHLPLLLSAAAANCFPTVAPTYASPPTNHLPLTPSAVAASRFQFHRSRTAPVFPALELLLLPLPPPPRSRSTD